MAAQAAPALRQRRHTEGDPTETEQDDDDVPEWTPIVQEREIQAVQPVIQPAVEPAARTKHPAQALGAAKDVLDRTGHKAVDELDILQTTATIDLDQIDHMTTEELEAARSLLRKLLGRGDS